MQQLMYLEPGKLEWQDRPVPKIEAADDALVRPLAVTRCDLDFYIATGLAPFPGPFAFGHETIGEVIDVGDGVAAFAPGDIVAVPFQISCGLCDACRHGWTNSCTSVPLRSAFGLAPLSGKDFGGGLAERLRVPFANHMLVKPPADIAPETLAAATDNLADGWRAVAPHLQRWPGADVLVMGGAAQSVALYAAASAVALGSRRVLYVDNEPDRLARAKAVGAEVRELTVEAGMQPLGAFPITVDGTGNPDALRLAVRSTMANGVCTSVAIYYEDRVALPLRYMYGAGITFVTGRVQSRMEMPAVMDAISCGHLHPEKIVSRTVAFSEAAEAMDDPGTKLVFVNDLG